MRDVAHLEEKIQPISWLNDVVHPVVCFPPSVSVTRRVLRCLASLVCTQSVCDYCPLQASWTVMRPFTNSFICIDVSKDLSNLEVRIWRGAKDKQSWGRIALFALGDISIIGVSCRKLALQVKGGKQQHQWLHFVVNRRLSNSSVDFVTTMRLRPNCYRFMVCLYLISCLSMENKAPL